MSATLDFEIIAVVAMKLLHRIDNKISQRHLDRPTPAGVSAEHAGMGFCCPITGLFHRAVRLESIRFALVNFSKRAHAQLGKNFRLVQDATQQALHAMATLYGEEAALPCPRLVP